MKRTFFAIIAVFFLVAPATAQEQENLIVGRTYSYLLDPPSGWAADYKAGQIDGVPVVFYPEGTTLDETLVSASSYADEDGEPFMTFVINDAIRIKSSKPGVRVELVIKEKDRMIYHFINKKEEYFAATLYLKARSNFTVLFNLTAKNEGVFKANLDILDELATSYQTLNVEEDYSSED